MGLSLYCDGSRRPADLTHCITFVSTYVVFIKPRKHLSSHPKADTWDQVAIQELSRKLTTSGEKLFYSKAQVNLMVTLFCWLLVPSLMSLYLLFFQEALDTHIRSFNERHSSDVKSTGAGGAGGRDMTPFESRTAFFKALKSRASEVCTRSYVSFRCNVLIIM